MMNMMSKKWIIACPTIAAVVALGSSALCAQSPFYEVIECGTFGTGDMATWEVNDLGHACGYGLAPNGLNDHAFFSIPGGDIVNIQPLNAPAGGYSWGYGMNNLDQVVGYCNNETGTTFHAFLWSESTGTVDLGVPSWAVGDFSRAEGINDAGVVVGMVGSVPFNLRGCIWIGETEIEIPTFGGVESRAKSVNDLHDVVGMARLESGKMRGFVVPSADVALMIELEAPEGGGAWATDINNKREVVGWGTNADGTYHALYWSLDAGMVYLQEPIDEFGWQSFAYGINESGDIVGKLVDPGGENRACIWTGGEVYILENYLVIDEDVRYTNARNINEAGWIATAGNYPDGSRRAQILKPFSSGNSPDINGDGIVNGADLTILLAAWGACTADCPADLDSNGVVNGADLTVLLAAWTN